MFTDTFVVLGSLGGQLDVEPKRWFALGTISASFLWFFGLAILAAAGTAPAHGKITAHYQSGSGMCHVVYSLAAGETVLLMHKPCSVRRYLMEK